MSKISEGITQRVPGSETEHTRKFGNQTGECFPWSEGELTILSENYPNLEKSKLLALLPKRTWSAITTRSYLVGIHRHPVPFVIETARQMSEGEKGYLGGAIDCDGYISLMRRHRSNNFQLWIGVTNTDYSLVKRCQERANIGRIHKATQGHLKPAYTWVVHSFSGVRSLLEIIEPFLVRKRRQAQLGLRFLDIRNGLIRTKEGWQITDEVLGIYQEMRKINGDKKNAR